MNIAVSKHLSAVPHVTSVHDWRVIHGSSLNRLVDEAVRVSSNDIHRCHCSRTHDIDLVIKISTS